VDILIIQRLLASVHYKIKDDFTVHYDFVLKLVHTGIAQPLFPANKSRTPTLAHFIICRALIKVADNALILGSCRSEAL
jgi:hypothetical protein